MHLYYNGLAISISLLEQLDPARVVVVLKDLGGSPRVVVALDDDGDEGGKHEEGLEGVRPHHSLDSSLGR